MQPVQYLRKYGSEPFSIAVLHGGPGAPGGMAPVARELSCIGGILEPWQTAPSVEGQILELFDLLKKNGTIPVTLIGWSWGAMLGFIFTSHYPALVKKLILISSGVYTDEYSADIMNTRLSRLNQEERAEATFLMKVIEDPATNNNHCLKRFGDLMSKADSYDPLTAEDEDIECQFNIYQSVWKEASELRRRRVLLEAGHNINCPVVAIHGDYDPHPVDGIREPLSQVLKDFRLILLDKCGHQPWLENAAREKFYTILKKEIQESE